MQRRLSLVAHHGLNRLAAREHAWLERLNGVRLPGWEVGLLRLASRLGDGMFWYALMLALLVRHGGEALPAVLSSMADFLDEENEVVIKSVTSLIEPLILIVLGLIVGTVAISMFLPLFDLASSAGTGSGPAGGTP